MKAKPRQQATLASAIKYSRIPFFLEDFPYELKQEKKIYPRSTTIESDSQWTGAITMQWVNNELPMQLP